MSTALTIVLLVSDTVVIEPVGTDTVIGTVSSVFSVALSRMACTREDSTTVLGLPRWALNATSSLHAELISEVPVEMKLFYGMKGQRDYIIIIDIIIIIIIVIIVIIISIIIIVITLLLLLLSLLLSYYHYYFIVISTTFIRIEIKKIDTLILNNIL